MIQMLNMDCMEKKIDRRTLQKGKKRNPESVKKGALKRRRGSYFLCLNMCGNYFWRSPSNIKRGDYKFCSRRCYQEWQIAKPKGDEEYRNYRANNWRGKKSPSWKGGITPINNLIRTSQEYLTWKKNVHERDQWTCQKCGDYSRAGHYVFIEAHHKKPFSTHPDLRFDLNNGVTLCKKCHNKEPKGAQVYAQN